MNMTEYPAARYTGTTPAVPALLALPLLALPLLALPAPGPSTAPGSLRAGGSASVAFAAQPRPG